MTTVPEPLSPHTVGRRGERLAERYLIERGYRLVARNWRWRKGEIDLIVERAGELVFVEVKARRSHRFGMPEESITARKQGKLIQTAYAYLNSVGRQDAQWRIDVVAIDLNRRAEPQRIEHFENAVDGR